MDAVDAYIGLVKKFGFEDEDMNEYVFDRAKIGPEFVTIYVDSA